MTVLRHEAWTWSDGSLSFGKASLDGRQQLERISGPGQLVYIVHASSYDEAMQAHYNQQGWGLYHSDPSTAAESYAPTDLEPQLADYPDDLDLCRLNDRLP